MRRGDYHRGLCYAEPMARANEVFGLAAAERAVVLHADDIGLCHAANDGAFEALQRGAATAGSMMVPCEAFAAAAAYARRFPALDLGVHLTLNCEFAAARWGPAAAPAQVPSLLDADGYLRRTAQDTAAHARPEDVELELRTQIDRALDAGIDVTHLDAHLGTALFPPFLAVYTRLARDYRVPVFAVRPDPAKLARHGLGPARPLFERMCSELDAEGFPVLDDWDDHSLGFAPGGGAAHNRARLAAVGPGVTYLIIHPAQDGDELRRRAPESAHARAFEHRFYSGPEGAEALAVEGIRVVGMRPLRDYVRRAGGDPGGRNGISLTS